MKLMRNLSTRALCTGLALGLGTAAQAAPVNWVVDFEARLGMDETLYEVNGSFTYDADTNTYSDIGLQYLPASATSPTTFSVLDTIGIVPPNQNVFAAFQSPPQADLTGVQLLSGSFPALTNAGGAFDNSTLGLTFGFFFNECLNADCSSRFVQPVGLETSKGALVGTPVSAVPLPASALFLLAGLGGLGAMRRRTKQGS